jgi:hypothetical protein
MDVKGLNRGACHCGSVKFEVDLPGGFEDLSRCNCSMCARRGAVVTSVPLDAFRILKGAENLTLYQFNTKTAEHYFCATCGIYTHHRRRSNPNQFGVNVACIEGVNPFELGDIPTTDGINHLSDRR